MVLAVREDLLGCWEYMPGGPVERFKPVAPAVDWWAYSPEDGTGRNEGEAGREDGVGIELDVAVVLRLAPERRDCGRRIPVFIVLCAREFPPFRLLLLELLLDTALVVERNAVGAVGLETRRSCFSLSLTGDGESSIIRTQPEESGAGVRLRSIGSSMLRLCVLTPCSSAAVDFSEPVRVMDDEDDEDVVDDNAVGAPIVDAPR